MSLTYQYNMYDLKSISEFRYLYIPKFLRVLQKKKQQYKNTL